MKRWMNSLRRYMQLALALLVALASTHLLVPAEAAPQGSASLRPLADRLGAVFHPPGEGSMPLTPAPPLPARRPAFLPTPERPDTTFISPVPAPPEEVEGTAGTHYYYVQSVVNEFWETRRCIDLVRISGGLQSLVGPEDGASAHVYNEKGEGCPPDYPWDDPDNYYVTVDFGLVFEAGAYIEFREAHRPDLSGFNEPEFAWSEDGQSFGPFNQFAEWTAVNEEHLDLRWSEPKTKRISGRFRYVRLKLGGWSDPKEVWWDAIRVDGTPLSPDARRTISKEDPCVANNPQHFQGDPVNTFSGHFSYQQRDLFVPTRGLPLFFERSYNSLSPYATSLGYGWTHNYNLRLEFEADEVAVIAAHGSRLPYQISGASYIPGPGVRATLISSNGVYTWNTADQIRYTFNADGQLTAIRDRNDNVTTLHYSGNRLTSVTTPDGRALTFTYDGEGHITQLSDPAGRTVGYGYDGAGNLAMVTDTLGFPTSFTYDKMSRLKTITDPNGHTVLTNDYDDLGRIHEQKDALGNTTVFEYGFDGEYHTSVWDPHGHGTTYYYDLDGRLLEIFDALGYSIYYLDYDDDWNPTWVMDQQGHWTNFEYDTPCACRPTRVTDELNNTVYFAYDGMGNLISLEDPLGRVTNFGYEAKGNPMTITNTLGYVTSLTYNAYGQPTSVTDAEGRMVGLDYDTYGNLRVITDALGYTAHLSYDDAGRPTTMTDAQGRVTRYTTPPGTRRR